MGTESQQLVAAFCRHFPRLHPVPTTYLPEWVSPELERGMATIEQHLQKHHGIEASELVGLSPDECYQKHDALHMAEVKARAEAGGMSVEEQLAVSMARRQMRHSIGNLDLISALLGLDSSEISVETHLDGEE